MPQDPNIEVIQSALDAVKALVANLEVTSDSALTQRLAALEALVADLVVRVDVLESVTDPDPWPDPDPDPEPDPDPDPDPDPPGETGLLIDFKLDTEAEIQSLHHTTNAEYPATDPRACHYDASVGGAKARIIPGEQMSSIWDLRRKTPAPITGVVRAEYEFYVPQSFYDLDWPTMEWNTIKTFRLFNNLKRETNQDTSGTITLRPEQGDLLVRSTGTGADFVVAYLPPADTWVKHIITKDYATNMLSFKATNAVTGEVLFDGSHQMASLIPIDNIAALLHSTSRKGNHDGNQTHETFMGYRNLKLIAEE